jgi:hypothetical protein
MPPLRVVSGNRVQPKRRFSRSESPPEEIQRFVLFDWLACAIIQRIPGLSTSHRVRPAALNGGENAVVKSG